MIAIAMICTILGGILGAFLEPVSLSVSVPIAIMGAFILKAIKDKKEKLGARHGKYEYEGALDWHFHLQRKWNTD